MRSLTGLAVLLALLASVNSQNSADVTALQGLQACIQASKSTITYVNGWGLGLSTSSTGRKMLQTAQDCAEAAAISSAIPCTATSTPATPGANTTPSGVPTGTSTSDPCGDSSNPVPWTGLLCTGDRVTSVVISQLGPNVFQGTCNVGNLTDLAGLTAASIVDFTDSGLSGTVPAAWGAGAGWAGSLTSLTLAENPNISGPIPDLSGLTALTSLAISNSSFSGPIPANFSSFPALLSFTAVGNKLTGALPSSLPPKLTTLNVGYNQLNGSLPAYNSSTLSYLQVNNNNLTGCLPASWTSGLTNITHIDVSYNQLAGPIPSSWQASGAFPTLQTIDLVGNQLCGSLGNLGTPVGPVGQNNPSATRLVPSPGSLPACSGTSCTADPSALQLYALGPNGAPAPAPGPNSGNALSPFTAIAASTAPGVLPVLPTIAGR